MAFICKFLFGFFMYTVFATDAINNQDIGPDYKINDIDGDEDDMDMEDNYDVDDYEDDEDEEINEWESELHGSDHIHHGIVILDDERKPFLIGPSERILATLVPKSEDEKRLTLEKVKQMYEEQERGHDAKAKPVADADSAAMGRKSETDSEKDEEESWWNKLASIIW